MKPNNDENSGVSNRTGVLIAPELAQELLQGVEEFSPEATLDQSEAEELRAVYVREGLPIGSFPEGEDAAMTALLDKLSSRLAFERSGVRLYEALMRKRRAAEDALPEPSLNDLQHIRDEELKHMQMLEQCIIELGGDPTVVSPSADIGATMTMGVLQVVADPRTTISQCLEAILAAELLDNDCWGVLTKMVEDQGMEDELAAFEEAVAEEQEHLEKVRGWILESAIAT